MAHCLRHRLALASLAALLVAVACPAWANQVVYSQPPDFQGLFASQNDTAAMGFGPFAISYDNFSLASATTINQVLWTGGYYNPQSPGAITAWTVTLWSDNAGQPGSSLAAFTFMNNGGETFLQNDAIGEPVYSYREAVNFSASGSTTYWLSVVPDISLPPQWGWTSSSKGDGLSYTDLFGNRLPNTNDLAFSLSAQGPAVPEPGNLMLLGSGIVCVAGILRRKFRA